MIAITEFERECLFNSRLKRSWCTNF